MVNIYANFFEKRLLYVKNNQLNSITVRYELV